MKGLIRKQILNHKKRRAIRSYLQKMPALLRRDHGKKKRYRPEQISRTIANHSLNIDHVCYALALYATPSQFKRFHEERGENCDYNAMRDEIATTYFGGNADFQTSEAYISMSSSHDASLDSGSSNIDVSSSD